MVRLTLQDHTRGAGQVGFIVVGAPFAMKDAVKHCSSPAGWWIKERTGWWFAKEKKAQVMQALAAIGAVDDQTSFAALPAHAAAPRPAPSGGGLVVQHRFALPFGQLCVSQGNIVDFAGDAIVNAADTKCVYGKGVDGAINAAGGQELIQLRLQLPLVPGTGNQRCPVGEARVTEGGRLRCHVIHAVGPNYNPKASRTQPILPNNDQLLYEAYRASMTIAKQRGFRTVAFSLLSAGYFLGRKPLHEVLDIAARALRDGAYAGLEEAHLVAFTLQPRGAEAKDARAIRQAAIALGLAPAQAAAAATTTACAAAPVVASPAGVAASGQGSQDAPLDLSGDGAEPMPKRQRLSPTAADGSPASGGSPARSRREAVERELRRIDTFKGLRGRGNALTPAQLAKMDTEPSLRAELAELAQ